MIGYDDRNEDLKNLMKTIQRHQKLNLTISCETTIDIQIKSEEFSNKFLNKILNPRQNIQLVILCFHEKDEESYEKLREFVYNSDNFGEGKTVAVLCVKSQEKDKEIKKENENNNNEINNENNEKNNNENNFNEENDNENNDYNLLKSAKIYSESKNFNFIDDFSYGDDKIKHIIKKIQMSEKNTESQIKSNHNYF